MNYKMPDRLKLANLPTPIEKLKPHHNQNIYVKRDDYTGIELSGNKVRKLEYLLYDAKEKAADVLITTGAYQSNHARATVAAALKVGMKAHLVLTGDVEPKFTGNLLLDQKFGAEFTFISSEESKNVEQIMQDIADDYTKKSLKAYIIPMGASNALGNFGYLNAFNEILQQEKELGIKFDVISCTVGSGGTYSGLLLGNHLSKTNKKIIGINVSQTSQYFVERVSQISNESLSILGIDENINKQDIKIIDGFVGRGYGLSTAEELDFIDKILKSEGVYFDPVYTGKAIRGLYKSIEAEKLDINSNSNILFIHTGGFFKLFAE